MLDRRSSRPILPLLKMKAQSQISVARCASKQSVRSSRFAIARSANSIASKRCGNVSRILKFRILKVMSSSIARCAIASACTSRVRWAPLQSSVDSRPLISKKRRSTSDKLLQLAKDRRRLVRLSAYALSHRSLTLQIRRPRWSLMQFRLSHRTFVQWSSSMVVALLPLTSTISTVELSTVTIG